MPGDDLYLLHRTAIEQAIRAVCRRQRLSVDDAEEFASSARLHLIERDFEALRRFQGRSSLSTYLVTVVTHVCQDWRNARWGKWRPSADARRLGPIAIHLERLVKRDGFSFDEACETLRTNFRVPETHATIEAIAARLPWRTSRRFVSDQDLADAPADGPAPDGVVASREATAEARIALHVLTAALASLSARDQLVIGLHFGDGLKYADIARMLRVEAKQLYRRMERVLGQLRLRLEREGVDRAVARQVLASRGLEEALELAPECLASVRLIGTDGRPEVPEGSA